MAWWWKDVDKRARPTPEEVRAALGVPALPRRTKSGVEWFITGEGLVAVAFKRARGFEKNTQAGLRCLTCGRIGACCCGGGCPFCMNRWIYR